MPALNETGERLTMAAIDALKKELQDVERQLEGFDELVQQRDRLRAALRVLEGGAPIATGKASAGPARGRRTAGSIDDAAIVGAIHAYGEPAPQQAIREALGLTDKDSNRLSMRLKAMVDDGLLKRQGERRASRYTPA
jgi:hypothetical protein